MNKKLKKFVASICIGAALLVSTANCFGKFAIVRKLYAFNEGVNIGGPWVAKVVRTLLMYLLWWIPVVFGVCVFLDLVIFNLIEFWTDSNPLAYNEYDKNGEFTKTFESENGTMKLTYLNYGSKLRINMTSGEKQDEFIVLRSEPGKIFKETDGKLQEVSIKTSNVGEKTILKMAVDGKLQSTKIVDTKEVNTLKAEYLHSL